MKENNDVKRQSLSKQHTISIVKVQYICLIIALIVLAFSLVKGLMTEPAQPARALFECEEGIYLYNAEEDRLVLLGGEGFAMPIMSPSGTHIACAKGKQIWIMSSDGQSSVEVGQVDRDSFRILWEAEDVLSVVANDKAWLFSTDQIFAPKEHYGSFFGVLQNGDIVRFENGQWYIGDHAVFKSPRTTANPVEFVVNSKGEYFGLIEEIDDERWLITGEFDAEKSKMKSGYEIKIPDKVSGELCIDIGGRITCETENEVWRLQPLINDFEQEKATLSKDEQAQKILDDMLKNTTEKQGISPENIVWIKSW